MAGVLGIVAAFTFSTACPTRVADPGRFGQTFQLISEIGGCRRATQGLVFALAGLLIGLPMGLVVGRLLCQTVASYSPVQYVPPIATVVLVVIVPAALR